MTPKKDDNPEKQRMKGQTEVKHTILENYLQPWLLKITELNNEVRYIDGFAGWGWYPDGSPGSPLIAMNVANKILEQDYGRIGTKLDSFYCDFVEKNDSNFNDLEEAVKEVKEDCSKKVKPRCLNQEFEEFARDFTERKRTHTQPAFIFVDPFGFSGLPFEIIDELMNLRSTGMEVFITFMSGKMARFMDSPDHKDAIDEIIGTDRWRDEIDSDLSRDERAKQFVQLYEERLREEAGVDYVWPFEMKKEDTRQTNYYLVHATNHFDGFKLMKEIMYRAGAEDQFAYLGPDHYPYIDEQASFEQFDEGDERERERRIEDLANQLHRQLAGQQMTFKMVMMETYQETTLIEKHYRDACKLLRDQDRAEIINKPDENGSISGLQAGDEVKFKDTADLGDFT